MKELSMAGYSGPGELPPALLGWLQVHCPRVSQFFWCLLCTANVHPAIMIQGLGTDATPIPDRLHHTVLPSTLGRLYRFEQCNRRFLISPVHLFGALANRISE